MINFLRRWKGGHNLAHGELIFGEKSSYGQWKKGASDSQTGAEDVQHSEKESPLWHTAKRAALASRVRWHRMRPWPRGYMRPSSAEVA